MSYPSSLLGRYLSFLRNPGQAEVRQKASTTSQSRPNVPAVSTTLKELWRLYALNVLVLIPITLAIGIFLSGRGNLEDQNVLAELVQSISALQIFLLTVVIAPVTEEIVFRLPLRYSPRNLAIPLSLVAVYLFSPGFLFARNPAGIWLVNGGLVIACSFGLSALLRRFGPRQRLWGIWQRRLRFLLYFSALLFGLIHIFNYDPGLWAFAPLLTLPQLLLGLTLGYVRLNQGFRWAVVYHALHNFSVLAPTMVMMSLPEGLQTALINSQRPESGLWLAGLLGGVVAVYFLGGLFLVLRSARRSWVEWRGEQRAAE